MTTPTDHFATTLDLVKQVETDISSLQVLHTAGAAPRAIAGKYDNIRNNLALAKVHSQLAVAQALHGKAVES